VNLINQIDFQTTASPQPYNASKFVDFSTLKATQKVQESEWKMESNKDDLKTQFQTREGCYRLLNLSEYSRPNRVGYQSNQNSPQVRVSFVSLPQSSTQSSAAQQQQSEKGKTEKISSSTIL
jgi:hypothetical protein